MRGQRANANWRRRGSSRAFVRRRTRVGLDQERLEQVGAIMVAHPRHRGPQRGQQQVVKRAFPANVGFRASRKGRREVGGHELVRREPKHQCACVYESCYTEGELECGATTMGLLCLRRSRGLWITQRLYMGRILLPCGLLLYLYIPRLHSPAQLSVGGNTSNILRCFLEIFTTSAMAGLICLITFSNIKYEMAGVD